MDTQTLTIKLAAEVAEFISKIKGVESLVTGAAQRMRDSFSGVWATLGASVSVAGLGMFVKAAINAADQLDELSQRYGISAKELSGLQLAFKQSGVDTDAMASSMGKLQRAMADGNQGLAAIGVTTRNTDGSLRGTSAVLLDVADKFAGLEDGAGKTALAVEIFGKSGADMVPLLNSGSDGIKDMITMAERLGLVLEDDAAAKAGNFNDTLELISMGAQGVGRGIATKLLPTLQSLAENFLTTMTSGDRLAKTADFLSNILKGLFIAAVAGVEIFSTVGKTMGMVAAQIAAMVRGNFAEAEAIGREGRQDISSGWQSTLQQIKDAWNDTGGAAVAAMASASGAAKKQAPDLKALEAGAKAAAKALEEQRKEQEAQTKLVAELAGVQGDYMLSLQRLQAQREKGNLSEERYVELVTALIAKQPMAKKLMDDQAKATAELAAQQNQAFDDYFDRLEKERLVTEAQIKTGRTTLEQLKFENSLLGMNATERAVATAMRQLETQGVVKGTKAWEAYADAIRSAVIDRETQSENMAFWQSIESTAKGVWTDVADSGVSAFERVGKTIKSAVLDLIWQLTGKQWLISIGASMGIPGAAQAAATSAGTNALGSAGTSALFGGASLTSMGQYFATGFMNTVAGTGAATGAAAGRAIGGASGTAMQVGAYAPYAIAAVAALAAIGAFRTTKTVGGGLTGTLGEGDINAYDLNRKSGYLFGGPDYSVADKGVAAQSAALQTAFLTARASMVSMADTLGLGSDAIKSFTTAIGNDLIHPDTGGLGLKLDGLTADQAAAKVQEALSSANEAMARTVLSSATLTGWMARLAAEQTSATTTLQVLVDYPNKLLEAAGTSRDALVQTFAQGLLTGDAATAGQSVANQLVASIEQSMLGNAAGQIFDIVNRGIVTPVLDAMLHGQSITEALSQASLDATIAAATAKAQALGAIFNDPKFVQAMQALQTGLGSVLGSVGGALSFTPQYQSAAVQVQTPVSAAATAAGDAVTRLAQVFADASSSLTETGQSLAVDLMRAMGDEMGAAQAERDQYLVGFADLTQAERDLLAARYDQNQGIRDQITAIEKGKEVADERRTLESRIYELEENTAALRQVELAALNETNRPLQQRIYALEDEAKAAVKAKESSEKLKAAIASLVGAADSTVSKFLSGSSLSAFQYARSAENLNALGVGATSGAQLQAASIRDIQAAVMQLVMLGSAAPEVKAQVLSLGAALIDLKQAAIDTAAAADKARSDQQRGLQTQIAELSGDYTTLVLLRQQEIDQMDGPLLQGMARYLDALKAQAAATAKEASRLQQQTGLQRQIAELSGDKVTLAAFRELEIAQLDGPLNQSLQRYIYTLQDQKAALDDAAKGTDKAYSALERAVAAQRKTLETQHTAAQQLAQEVGSIFDTLKSNIRDLSGEVDSTQKFIGAAGQRYIAASLATARAGGGLPDGQDLADAIAASRAAIDVNSYATRSSFDRDKLSLIGQLSQLQSISGTQKSAAEQQIATAQAQLDALDQTLETAKTQIATLRDIDNSVIGVELAVSKLALAVAAESAAKAVAAGTSPATGGLANTANDISQTAQLKAAQAAEQKLADLLAATKAADAIKASADAAAAKASADYNATLVAAAQNQDAPPVYAAAAAAAAKANADYAANASTDAAKLAIYTSLLNMSTGLTDGSKQHLWTASGLTGAPTFATGGAFTNGIVSRPTMFDMAQMGEAGSEAIMPLANIGGSLGVRYAGPDFTHFGRGMEAMAAEITALRAELQGLRAEARATAVNTGRTQDLLKRVSRNGEALQTEAAT